MQVATTPNTSPASMASPAPNKCI